MIIEIRNITQKFHQIDSFVVSIKLVINQKVETGNKLDSETLYRHANQNQWQIIL